MANRDPVDDDTWLEFLGPSSVQTRGGRQAYCGLYCGLCGNSGVVDTRGKVVSPRGEDCGVRAFCICPNGRSIKHDLGDSLPPEKTQ